MTEPVTATFPDKFLSLSTPSADDVAALMSELMMDDLLNNDDIQAVLKQETFRNFINGLVRMNKAGRFLHQKQP